MAILQRTPLEPQAVRIQDAWFEAKPQQSLSMQNPPDHAFTGPELCALPAHEVVDLLNKREVSTAELLDAAFSRIEAVETHVNALPTLCRERALDAAQAQHTDNGPRFTLLGGLPIGIKDLTPVEGVRTTFGTRGMADHIPDQSDPLVTHLEQSGGVVVGKTNTPEFGAGGNTFNEVFGYTRNPWDTRLNAGGSSGGAAVSLATGELWLSHGSDHAGSLRTPASFCGIVGMRPGPGLVRGGAEAMLFHREGVSGPMARSVRDCALFLDAMAGFDAGTPLSVAPPSKSYQQSVLEADQNVRIAFAPDLGGYSPVEDTIRATHREAMLAVQANGGLVDEACPELPELDRTYRTLRGMMWAAGPGRAPDALQQHFKATLAQNIDEGRQLTADDIYDAELQRSTLFANVTRFLENFDVLAFPVTGLMPMDVEIEYPRDFEDTPFVDYIDWLRFSNLATTTGLPAISVPVGFSCDGIPVGIQLLGSHRSEARLLAVARAVELAVGVPTTPIDPNVTRGHGLQ